MKPAKPSSQSELGLIRHISAWLFRKIIRLFILGVSATGVANTWSLRESIILKDRKADAENNARKKERGKEIMAKVTDLDRQIQKLTKDFSKTSAQAEELAKEVAEVSRKMESLGLELASGQELAAALAKTLEANNAKIETLTAQIAEFNPGGNHLTVGSTTENDLTALTEQVSSASQNVSKQESAISEISSRVDSIEREILLKINERLESLDQKFKAIMNTGPESRYGEVTNHRRTVFPESINPENEEENSGENLAVEIKKLSDRIAVLENHTSSYGTTISALQNNIANVTKRLDNIEEAGSRNGDYSENEL